MKDDRMIQQLEKKIRDLEYSLEQEKKKAGKDRQDMLEYATILANLPLLLVTLDENFRVIKTSLPLVQSLGVRPKDILGRLPGEVLRCVHYLDDPDGCGAGPACQACALRNTIMQTFETGKSRQNVRATLSLSEEADARHLLVTTVLLQNGLAKQVVVSIEDVSKETQMQHLMILQRNLGNALGIADNLDDALAVCLDTALQIGQFDCGAIYLVDPISGNLDLKAHKHLPRSFMKRVRHYNANSVQARVVKQGKPIYQTYAQLLKELKIKPEQIQMQLDSGLRNIAVVPVINNKKVIAVMNMASYKIDVIAEFDRYALETIAAQAAGILAKISADHACKRSNQNLQTLFDSLDDFLFILDSEGKIVKYNNAVLKRLGYSREELTSMHVLEVHPPERRQKVLSIIEKILGGKINCCHIPLKTRDGSLIPVETKIAQGFWDGKPSIFGITRDISLRLEAEKARQVSEDRLTDAIESIDAGFVLFDADDRLVISNTKYAEIYKLSSDVLVPGTRFEDILRYGLARGQYLDAVGQEDTWLAERMAAYRSNMHNFEQRMRNGRWLKILERKTKDGSTVGIRVDITDVKQSEEKICRALKEKEILLREIHHRVKNNMQVISSLLSLQAGKINDAGVVSLFSETQARVKGMAVVHEILYQSDNLSEIFLQSYIENLVNHIVHLFSFERESVSVDVDTGDVVLTVNHSISCGMIVAELVTNSLKYAEPKDRELQISVEAGYEPENQIMMTIADNGAGSLATFDPANTRTLGLQMVTEIITDQLEGTYQVERDRGFCWVIAWPKQSDAKTGCAGGISTDLF